MLTYKGYVGKVELDEDAGILHGEILHLQSVITFQGESVSEVKQAFQDSVDDYLDWCAERGKEPEKPFSGKFMVRLDRDLHRDVAVAAQLKGLSLNSWVAQTLKDATRRQLRPAEEVNLPINPFSIKLEGTTVVKSVCLSTLQRIAKSHAEIGTNSYLESSDLVS